MSLGKQKINRGYFAGSFNPFTIGHADIVARGLKMFDEIIIGLGYNINKSAGNDVSEREEQIKHVYADNPRVKVEVYSGLTAEAARKAEATALLRGVRDTRDFEYERQMAEVNRRLFGIETILLPADPALSSVSSSMVRELEAHSVDVSPFLPKPKQN